MKEIKPSQEHPVDKSLIEMYTELDGDEFSTIQSVIDSVRNTMRRKVPYDSILRRLAGTPFSSFGYRLVDLRIIREDRSEPGRFYIDIKHLEETTLDGQTRLSEGEEHLKTIFNRITNDYTWRGQRF